MSSYLHAGELNVLNRYLLVSITKAYREVLKIPPYFYIGTAQLYVVLFLNLIQLLHLRTQGQMDVV